jgi:hypothetical protein
MFGGTVLTSLAKCILNSRRWTGARLPLRPLRAFCGRRTEKGDASEDAVKKGVEFLLGNLSCITGRNVLVLLAKVDVVQ